MRRLTPDKTFAKKAAAAVVDDVDVAGLEAWLAAHPPQSLVPLADRLLVASVDRTRAEGPALAQTVMPHLVAAASQPEAVHHLTTLAVCLACADDLGVDSPDLRMALAIVSRALGDNGVDGMKEPFRSTARHWLWRAALRKEPAPLVDDDAPSERVLAFMFHSHRVLFAAGYGRTRLPIAEAGGFALANDLVDVDDGDQVALLLLCHACVEPAGDDVEFAARVSSLRAMLAKLQVKNGSIRTRVDDPIARHHAACVAVLALSLLRQRGQQQQR